LEIFKLQNRFAFFYSLILLLQLVSKEKTAKMKINKYIDHTFLKATGTKHDIIKLCNEAKEHDFYAVCVNGSYVELAAKELQGSDIAIAAVIGFPLGAMTKEAKVFEAKDCISKGANEIDMVLNIGYLIDGRYQEVEQEIREIKQAIGDNVLKVIFENCYLTKGQILKASELSLNAGADFVKTSTGFGTGGSNVEDVELMKSVVEGKAQIKAAGGVRDLETAVNYIKMGVTRLGTSSGVSLVTSGKSKEGEY
jgi:deoxyribose-phosphate aldolase